MRLRRVSQFFELQPGKLKAPSVEHNNKKVSVGLDDEVRFLISHSVQGVGPRLPARTPAIEYASAAVRLWAGANIGGAGPVDVVLRSTAFPNISAVVRGAPVFAGKGCTTGAAVEFSTAAVWVLAARTGRTFLVHAGTGAVNDATATVRDLAAQAVGTGPCRATGAAVNGSTATVPNLAAYTIGGTTLRHALAGAAVNLSTATIPNLAAYD